MIEPVVPDASAVLCLLQGEPGARRVAQTLPFAAISAVNLAEVYAKLSQQGGSEADIKRAIGALPLTIVSFDGDQAKDAGMMAPMTKAVGLSLGDRACLALASHMGRVALTADRAWTAIAGPLGIRVEVIS